MKVVAFIWLGAVIGGPLSAQRAPLSPRVALVRDLYSEFACEAVVDSPGCDQRHEFVDLPSDVLRQYFDASLARLWKAERARAARTHEVGKLDFSPIWDSQDPPGTYVRILAIADSSHVEVELRHLGEPEVRKLRYTLMRTSAGWRIHDIEAPKKWSLVALLSGKDSLASRP
jgi:hypothetical protein